MVPANRSDAVVMRSGSERRHQTATVSIVANFRCYTDAHGSIPVVEVKVLRSLTAEQFDHVRQ
jgi:hypothetical protein